MHYRYAINSSSDAFWLCIGDVYSTACYRQPQQRISQCAAMQPMLIYLLILEMLSSALAMHEMAAMAMQTAAKYLPCILLSASSKAFTNV
jgi:hypothetical protein